MIKHIVLFRLKDEAHGNTKAENARIIKQKLEALRGLVPGMLDLEIGMDFSNAEASADVVLYSKFETRAALQAYLDHPVRRAVLPFLAEARSEHWLVDYEMGD